MFALAAQSRGSRRVGAVLAIALAVAACGGAASTPAPSSAPSPTPLPTPTPVDVAGAFLSIVGDPDFSARMEIEGTMEMGVTATLSGTITGSGEDSRTIMSVEFGTTTTETETIRVDGRSFSRTSPGPWLEEPASGGAGSEDDDLIAWLRRLAEIEDLGIETKDGRQLHHLSAGDEPVPPEALGLDASTFKDPSVTIDFYAEDDGTPAVFVVDGSWVQAIGGQDFNIQFTMDMLVSNVGAPIRIEPPIDVWTWYEGELGYRVAHPATFSVENRDGYDAFVEDGGDWIYVQTWPDAAGLNEQGFLEAMLDAVADTWGAPVEEPVVAVLGGEPGYMATFQFTFEDGTEGIAFDVFAMHDNVGWDVTLFSAPGAEAADYEVLEQFLSTFAFVD